MVRAVHAVVVVVVVAVVTRASLVYGDVRMDPLFRARCAAQCSAVRSPDKTQCESECGLLKRSKPGRCPDTEDLRWYDKACVHACSEDVDCEETEKCCRTNCGATCQLPAGLDQEQGLPTVPSNLTVSEDSKRQRVKRIQWRAASAAVDAVFYVLQLRSHVGISPDPRLFGPWKPRKGRRRNYHILTGLKPAHWYQVRVAAVNANGSRGFSLPSNPFTLQIGPSKPDEPRNLTVQRPGWVEGRLWAELRWRRALSDLPLQHYKVFWSHCVKTGLEETPAQRCKHNLVIVKHKTVNYKTTSYILKDLEPQSLYFIQVQAVTIFYGNKKLSSDKAVVFIDTNKLKNATYNWRVQPERSVRNLRVLNYYRSTPDTLQARLVWTAAADGRFLVKWVPHVTCSSVTNRPTYQATTEDLEYDIDNLEFNCKYQVSVSAMNNAKSAVITITTPSCHQVLSKLPCS